MKQIGKFYIYAIEDDIRKIEPIPNAKLYFANINDFSKWELVAQVDGEGSFNFDLPLGEYRVVATLGDGIEQVLANGSTFKLTAQSKVNAFEQWLNNPSIDTDSALLAKFREIMQRTETASESIKNTEGQLRKDINKKWDKEEGVTALAKKQDALEFIGTGKVMKEGAFGVGTKGVISLTESSPAGIYLHTAGQVIQGIPSEKSVLKFGGQASRWIGIAEGSGELSYMSYGNIIRTARDSRNTTIDSNGFIKAASPIIKLFNDRIEHSGFGDNEPIFEKLGLGQYKISNTLGLAQEGWTYEKPRGSDGQPYFRIVVEKLEDGCIVRVHDEYDTVEKAEITDINGNTRTVDKIVKILGQARDIKEHERWIDLRFHEEPEEHQEMEE